MKCFYLFILITFSISRAEARGNHPYQAFSFLDEKQSAMFYEVTYKSSEEEYEVSGRVLTHQDTKHYRHKLAYEYGLPNDLSLQLGLAFSSTGTIEKFNDQSLSIPNQRIKFRGLQGYEVSLTKRLPLSNSKTQYALKLSSIGTILKPKETNFAYPGYDLSLYFFLSHKHDDHYFTGELKSEIVGKKETKLHNGGQNEVIDAYSILGAKIGYLNENTIIPYHLTAYFYHTTDYNKKDQFFIRRTDKGFVWGAEVKFYKKINQRLEMYLAHLRESHVFNIVDSSLTSAVDYEIEKNETRLGLIWNF
jgi:hypothetical protein